VNTTTVSNSSIVFPMALHLLLSDTGSLVTRMWQETKWRSLMFSPMTCSSTCWGHHLPPVWWSQKRMRPSLKLTLRNRLIILYFHVV